MPMYRMRCTNCEEEEDIYCHHSMLEAFRCQSCDSKLEQVPAAANFKIEGARSHKGSDRKNYE